MIKQQRVNRAPASTPLSPDSEVEQLTKELLSSSQDKFSAQKHHSQMVTLDTNGLIGTLERLHKVLDAEGLSNELNEYFLQLRDQVAKTQKIAIKELYVLKRVYSRYFN